ncbi:hypothetical protein [Nocardioides sambongensis]|uniref:hypothetical protein n=1 Tax=Nocardioides sambongensis TaxID=2589074 RepID=UPI001128A939|nr:hypothetical protein [Nocardioides sambongensis]
MPCRKLRRGLMVAVGVLALGPLAACSDDEEPAGQPAPSEEPTVAAELQVEAELGEVRGRLDRSDRRELLGSVGSVVERWWQEGYVVVGDEVDTKAAFRGFTPVAARQAVRERGVTTNATAKDAEEMTVRRSVATVDVLAPGGTPRGATARVRLVMELTGEAERTEVLTGRVFLAPAKGEWRVFGFDLDRRERGGKA